MGVAMDVFREKRRAAEQAAEEERAARLRLQGYGYAMDRALLLHRPNNTSVVLRRRDVDAVALDPIVRHYRALADKRYTDRQVRFSR